MLFVSKLLLPPWAVTNLLQFAFSVSLTLTETLTDTGPKEILLPPELTLVVPVAPPPSVVVSFAFVSAVMSVVFTASYVAVIV